MRSSLLAPAQTRNVEMHAHDAEPRIADAHRRGDRAARFECWQMERVTLLDHDALAHEQRIAVPTDRIGAAVQQVDGNIVAMIFEHVRRDRTRARAEAAVGLLQSDDVGIEFAKNRQHSPRIAATVEADALAHIVAGDLNHRRGRAAFIAVKTNGGGSGLQPSSVS